jgi:hypothetical protein
MLTWVLVAWAGSLEKLPEVLAEASYGILVAVMLLTGRLVARETRSSVLGFAAMIAVGTTSLMAPCVRWYSAGQPLWAGFGILACLWYCQCWRRSGSWISLALACTSAVLAGWFWTIGHLAGPVATVYLWADGRCRSRRLAMAPLLASGLAVGLTLALAGSALRTATVSAAPNQSPATLLGEGLFHTAQAIPENLILANLGLRARTTRTQGVVFCLLLLGAWLITRWRQRRVGAPNPLECTGAALGLGSYIVEWSFRGYLDYDLLRTLNMGFIVPWYDAIPQIGAVLFVAGWCWGPMARGPSPPPPGKIPRVTRFEAMSLVFLIVLLIQLNWPRADVLWRKSAPPLLEVEQAQFPIVSLQSMRATTILLDQAAWQRRHLRRLDQAQQVVSRMGLSDEDVRAAFGRLDMPELPAVYEANGLLYYPSSGRKADVSLVRRALAPYLFQEKPPRPTWIPPSAAWPPPETPEKQRADMYGFE